MKNIRSAVLAAASIAFASTMVTTGAAAQFTAALVPPPPVPRVDTVARADSARQSAKELQERMTNIKEWVDSAAAALAAQPAQVPPVPADTARMPKMPPLPDSSRTRQAPPDTSGGRPRQPWR